MHYGSLQSEIVALGTFSGATPPVKISGFGYSNPVRNAKGDFTITLANGVDTTARGITASCTTTPQTVTINEGAGTDTSVNFLVVDAAGAAADSGVSFIVARATNP